VNRKQRRSQARSKSNSRRVGVTYLAIAGLASGSLGFATPAQAALILTPSNCSELEMDLSALEVAGGTLTVSANFDDADDTCNLSEGYLFQSASTIIGPTSGSLTLNFTGTSTAFETYENLDVSNLRFTQSAVAGIPHFIRGVDRPVILSQPELEPTAFMSPLSTLPNITVSNSTFFNSTFSHEFEASAIYAEGNIFVSDSDFRNLTSEKDGSAIYSYGELSVSNSTFASNTASMGGVIYSGSEATISNSTFESNSASVLGGAIHSFGQMSISNSTFESNTAEAGGAILSEGGSLTVSGSTFFDNIASQFGGAIVYVSGTPGQIASVDNSTFVNNAIGLSEGDGAALAFYSEGSIVSNSTFWNNGDDNDGSIDAELTHFFGNILANSTPGVEVIGNDRVNNFDGGANLYTDSSLNFVSPTTGEGSSRLVSLDDLKLSALALNTTGPVNTGQTKTVAIGADSVARNFYSTSSVGINPTGNSSFATRIAALDQRGVARQPSVNRLDVGAYEYGENPVVVPVETPALIAATIANQKIKFAPGSSKLTAASKKKLRTLATEIQAKGLKTVNLEGYTATLTQAAPSGKVFRVKLSKARTVAVEKYLNEQFKKANYSVTFTKSSKGAANRVKSNKTEKGRIDNRRVEIAIN
jgi:predicted outer membrane repeat protein